MLNDATSLQLVNLGGGGGGVGNPSCCQGQAVAGEGGGGGLDDGSPCTRTIDVRFQGHVFTAPCPCSGEPRRTG